MQRPVSRRPRSNTTRRPLSVPTMSWRSTVWTTQSAVVLIFSKYRDAISSVLSRETRDCSTCHSYRPTHCFWPLVRQTEEGTLLVLQLLLLLVHGGLVVSWLGRQTCHSVVVSSIPHRQYRDGWPSSGGHTMHFGVRIELISCSLWRQ